MALVYFKSAIIAAGIDFRSRMGGSDDTVNQVGEAVAPSRGRPQQDEDLTHDGRADAKAPKLRVGRLLAWSVVDPSSRSWWST